MEVTRILAEIDARALLFGSGTSGPVGKKSVGRPRKTAATALPTLKQPLSGRKKRNLSPEARKRIADAQKRRWAERRKVA